MPHELVTADYTHPAPAGSGFFQATTNGLASGNHWLEAVLHGLYEVVERDAIALWRAGGARARDAAGGGAGQRRRRGEHRGCWRATGRPRSSVRVWDVTSDIALPCFVALAVAPGGVDGVEPELGSGCHADRDVALARALSEAAQARLTRISGARDDFAPESFGDDAKAERQEMAAAVAARAGAAVVSGGAKLRRGDVAARSGYGAGSAGCRAGCARWRMSI